MTDNRGMIDHLLRLDIIMQKVYVDNNDKQLQFLSWNRWICCVVRMHQLIDRKLLNTVKDHNLTVIFIRMYSLTLHTKITKMSSPSILN